MALWICCGRDKPDVRIRVGLRGQDPNGTSTAKPFHGPLCNDCLARAGRIASPEQRWLFHQIMQRTSVTQNRGRFFGRGADVPERTGWTKPRAPRTH